MEVLEKFEKSLKIDGARLLIAVSGGLDSMALLELFRLLNLKTDAFELQVAHFNHKTRSGQSDLDARFVKEHCHLLGLDFHYGQMIEPGPRLLLNGKSENLQGSGFGKTSQNQAHYRKARLSFLENTLNKINGDFIVTAHHLDDQIETFLWRLMRGASTRGLRGISEFRHSYYRPLLGISRAELETFALQRDLKWVEDATNAENIYTRNKIRNEILPALRDVNPAIDQSILDLMVEIREVDSLLEKEASQLISWHKLDDGFEADVFKLRESSPVLRKKALSGVLLNLSRKADSITRTHIEQLDRMILKNDSSKLDLPGELLAEVSCGVIRLREKSNDALGKLMEMKSIVKKEITKISGPVKWKNWTLQLPVNDDFSHLESRDFLVGGFQRKQNLKILARVPKEKFESGLWVRSRRTSDVYEGRTLKKRLLDARIPDFWRDEIPLLADQNDQIIWAPFDLGSEKNYSDMRHRGEDFTNLILFWSPENP